MVVRKRPDDPTTGPPQRRFVRSPQGERGVLAVSTATSVRVAVWLECFSNFAALAILTLLITGRQARCWRRPATGRRGPRTPPDPCAARSTLAGAARPHCRHRQTGRSAVAVWRWWCGSMTVGRSRLSLVESAEQITVSRTVHAPVERVFALLADPDRHPDIDGSGTLRRARTHAVLTGVGDTFGMSMHRAELGDYQSQSLVVAYQRDKEIGWAPGPPGREPFGHTYTYRLEPDGDDRTVVSLTYDWSAVTEPRLRPRLPLITREELTRTLEMLAAALA